MSQVEHRAERSFAIKGTLVFTAQRDQFTIMENAYLVCEGKRLQEPMTRCRINTARLMSWIWAANSSFPVPVISMSMPLRRPSRESGRILRTASGIHGLTAMRFPMSPDLTILRTRNRPTPVLLSLFWLHRQRDCAPMQRPAAKRQRSS